MISPIATSKKLSRCVVTLVITTAIAGCATTSNSKLSQTQLPSREIDPVPHRDVQAVALQSTGSDGQTSWIIEPDVPRIPKVAGLDDKLPPHIERRLSYAFDLAQRGATYTADAEFRAVLGLCALELDARDGGSKRRAALREGLVALDEADDFGGDQIDWRDSADVRRVAAGHTTPMPQRESATAIDSIQAVQAYYAFAEDRLAFACEGMPGASLAYYGLGRTIADPGTRVAHAAGKATLLQRVALNVAPQNVLAGNELGVLLAQHGHLDEAEQIFRQCVARDARPEAWQNLSIIYARKGDQDASQIALAESEALAARGRSVSHASAQQSIAGEAASPGIANEPTKEKTKSSLLAKLNMSPQLPSIFRR